MSVIFKEVGSFKHFTRVIIIKSTFPPIPLNFEGETPFIMKKVFLRIPEFLKIK